ncbi:hypothetical protein [Streptomyces sp. NPDC018833]|uniref:hypothetical protein n=1 Tax=Streptomyces sp. NPDC018833 TaxID=3365053 RepID=UPI0037A52697
MLDDAARERPASNTSNVSGHLLRGVTKPVPERALQDRRFVDEPFGGTIAEVNGGRYVRR